MILRRVIEHVREQNWTAIAIDFVIVVAGVFVGIQVANWNQGRADRAEYEAALVRLGAEIDTNLAILDAFDPVIERSLKTGGSALTVLQSCVDSEENRRIVEAGLEEIRGTAGLLPHRKALEEITSNPRLLSQQSAKERQRFSEMLFYFDALQPTADSAERRPMESGMESNPILRIGAPYEIKATFFGSDWAKTRRKLELNVPLDEACRNDQLIKSFFNWERSQDNLPVISQKWRAEMMATKTLIEARR